MNAPNLNRTPPAAQAVNRAQAFEAALSKSLEGEVDFGLFTRGRYATDASIYQIIPRGVAFPKTVADIEAALTIAAEHDVPVIARGGGTSQNGQPIGHGLILDMSRHFNAVQDYDPEARRITVRPGMVLNTMNDRLRQDGLFFPVEPSTASRCTIGGMCGNNSSGARSLRFGKTADNVLAMEGLLHDGEGFRLDAAPLADHTSPRMREIMGGLIELADSHRDLIEANFPKLQRRVGGYNLDELLPAAPNLSHLLVGSEGTLAISTSVSLQLSPLPAHRVMGVCHFPDFRSAMATTQHLVALNPVAAKGGLERPRSLPQHHDVDEIRRQTRLLHRRLRRAAGTSRRLYRRRDRDFRAPQHPWHLVCPCLGRLSACPPDPQHEDRRGRARHAQHCR